MLIQIEYLKILKLYLSTAKHIKISKHANTCMFSVAPEH